MINEAIILAGGFGTRLTNVTDVPKPMAPINDIPFLEYLLNYLSSFKITTIHLAVGYKHEVIQAYFGNQFKDCQLNYVVEDTPLGTGGAIKKALAGVKSEEVLVLNGDTFFQVDFNQIEKFHHSHSADATLALKPMENFDRYGTVRLDNDGRISDFLEKKFCNKGIINGGVYLIKSKLFENMDLPKQFSIESDFFEQQYMEKQIMGYISTAYFVDIGIPADYAKAQVELPGLLS
ncbi:MAG: nucleotidyltransferase family protein [Vicingus serpentipes]|nr:nucleotidyltransferase family protein [Vicingus serpentipes]